MSIFVYILGPWPLALGRGTSFIVIIANRLLIKPTYYRVRGIPELL